MQNGSRFGDILYYIILRGRPKARLSCTHFVVSLGQIRLAAPIRAAGLTLQPLSAFILASVGPSGIASSGGCLFSAACRSGTAYASFVPSLSLGIRVKLLHRSRFSSKGWFLPSTLHPTRPRSLYIVVAFLIFFFRGVFLEASVPR